MKLLLSPLALAIALASASAYASDARTQKADRIARVLGVEQLLNEAQRLNAESTKEQAQIVLQEFRRNGMKEEVLSRFEKLVDQMADKVAAAWDAKQASRIYSEGLLQLLSDQELDDAERYLSSSEGQKAYTALSSSQAKMVEYINGRTNAVLQEEMASFMNQIRQARAK